MENKLDLDLDISPTALLMLRMLIHRNIDLSQLWNVTTRAWYNGRERGISLELSNAHGQAMFIVFGECRCSDSVFVVSWTGSSTMNGPARDSKYEAAYLARIIFPHTLDGFVNHVVNLIDAWEQSISR